MTQQKAQQEDGSGQESASSTLALREPDVIRRLRGVLYALQNFITQNGTGGLARMSFIITTFTDDMITELADQDPRFIEDFLAQTGQVIEWIGHGDNARLPDVMLPFAEAVNPTVSSPSTEPVIKVETSGSELEVRAS